MKKSHIKCVICGGNVVYDESNENFKCIDCRAKLSSEVFNLGKKNNAHLYLSKLKILFAILGALYLMYLLYRFLIY
jgi:hypothetical protein